MKIDVTIYNGTIKMQTTTVSGSARNVEKIHRMIENGDRFDISGTDIKVGSFETASSFLKKFN